MIATQPLAGTAPARAIAYLQGKPPETWLSTPVLGEAIDANPGGLASSLGAWVVRGLLRRRRPAGANYLEFALGVGKPETAQSDDGENGPDDEGEKPLRIRERPLTQPPVSSVFDMASPNGLGWKPPAVDRCDHGAPVDGHCVECAAEIAAGADPHEPDAHEHFARSTIDEAAPFQGLGRITTNPVEKPEVTPTGMRVALWSDGTLEVLRPSTFGGGFTAPPIVFTKAEARAIVDYLNAIDLDVLEEEPS